MVHFSWRIVGVFLCMGISEISSSYISIRHSPAFSSEARAVRKPVICFGNFSLFYGPSLPATTTTTTTTVSPNISPKTEDSKWCKISTNHTLCLFRGKFHPMLLRRRVLAKEIKEIVQLHNELRQKVAAGEETVQPKSSNMQMMQWNDSLAEVAQTWADQCVFKHDYVRLIPNFPCVGQNIAWLESSGTNCSPDFPWAIHRWYREVVQPGFNVTNIRPFVFSKPLGHYTQMLWAKTNLIGCGFSCFQNPKNHFIRLYVCNYAPCGNIKGATMYKVGNPCEECPNGCSRDYRSLCE